MSFNPYQYQSPQQRVREFFKGDNALSRLIIINIAVFLLVNVIGLFLWLFETSGEDLLIPWLAVPADTAVLIRRPWTLVTYMFYQQDLLHILFNMIVLYFGGRIFQEFLGDKRLTATYLLGGLVGAAFFILAYNGFPVFNEDMPYALALGSSASVLAILVAAATYVPDYTVQLFLFGRVKLKHIAIVFIVIDVLSIQRGNPGGHIAHLGGALWGYISIVLMKRGIIDFSIFIPGFSKDPAQRSRRQRRQWKTYKTTTESGDRPLSDDEYNKRKIVRQQKMDEILDKISKFGYDYLSQEEKEFLFKSGKEE